MITIKQQRVAEQIRHILGELFLRGLRDPRLQGLTVTEVRIDRELQYADVYVNALGDESREKDVMAGLLHATGFLRREVAGHLNLRHAPVLHFHWDPALARAEYINELLDSLNIPPDASDTSETPPPA